MFRRNRSAEVDNVRIDEPADRRAMFGEPCRAIDTGGRLDMMVDVAVAQMPEGQGAYPRKGAFQPVRSEEHTSELQSLMRISYAVFCLKKKTQKILTHQPYIVYIQDMTS